MTQRRSGPNPVLIVGGVVVAVLIAAVAAVVLTGGTDDGGPPASTIVTVPVDPGALDPRIPAALRSEVRPVEVDGESLPPLPESGSDPAIGMVPPILVGEDATGFVHTISPGIDAPLLLVFLAHWCPACNQELPVLVELGNAAALPEELRVYAILTAMDPSRPNWPPTQWLVDSGWPFAWIADEPDMDRNGIWRASDAFGLTGFPFNVLIDGGTVVDRWSGASSPEALLARLSARLG